MGDCNNILQLAYVCMHQEWFYICLCNLNFKIKITFGSPEAPIRSEQLFMYRLGKNSKNQILCA